MTDQYFVAYAPRWLTLDKLYIVIGLPGALLGLRVGGQLVALGHVYPSDPRAYFRPAWASRYEGRNLKDPELVSLDKHNFLLPTAEVASAKIKTRRNLWTGPIPNSGILVVNLRAGRSRRFILLGEQRRESVASILEAASILVETGAPRVNGRADG